jgi:hypothetical protein
MRITITIHADTPAFRGEGEPELIPPIQWELGRILRELVADVETTDRILVDGYEGTLTDRDGNSVGSIVVMRPREPVQNGARDGA